MLDKYLQDIKKYKGQRDIIMGKVPACTLQTQVQSLVPILLPDASEVIPDVEAKVNHEHCQV